MSGGLLIKKRRMYSPRKCATALTMVKTCAMSAKKLLQRNSKGNVDWTDLCGERRNGWSVQECKCLDGHRIMTFFAFIDTKCIKKPVLLWTATYTLHTYLVQRQHSASTGSYYIVYSPTQPTSYSCIVSVYIIKHSWSVQIPSMVSCRQTFVSSACRTVPEKSSKPLSREII